MWPTMPPSCSAGFNEIVKLWPNVDTYARRPSGESAWIIKLTSGNCPEGTTSTQFALSAWPCRDDDVDAITYIAAINADNEVNEQVYKYLPNGDGARDRIMDRRSCLRMVAGGFENSQIPLRPDLGIDAVDAITYSFNLRTQSASAPRERVKQEPRSRAADN